MPTTRVKRKPTRNKKLPKPVSQRAQPKQRKSKLPPHIQWLLSLSEAAFTREIIKAAEAEGWVAIHHPDSRRATGKGLLDIFLMHHERVKCFWIEVKRQHGRLSYEQKQMLISLHCCGYEAIVIRPKDWDSLLARLAR